MNVHLEFVAMLHLKGARSGQTVALPEGATLATLLEQLAVAPPHRKAITLFVNEQRATATTKLKDGDKVFLALPISGG